MILFEDRRDGGLQLVEKLKRLKDEPCVVLGLPRGGVPVAYEIALDTVDALTREADQLVYAAAPKQFLSVSSFYHSFPQTSDAEVRHLLTRGR